MDRGRVAFQVPRPAWACAPRARANRGQTGGKPGVNSGRFERCGGEATVKPRWECGYSPHLTTPGVTTAGAARRSRVALHSVRPHVRPRAKATLPILRL